MIACYNKRLQRDDSRVNRQYEQLLVRDYIMPYFVYKITDSNSNEHNLDLQKSFDTYREARSLARSMRAELDAGDSVIVKIIFADDEQEAEERLTETREAPILREWEK
jgi:hypothetical protein